MKYRFISLFALVFAGLLLSFTYESDKGSSEKDYQVSNFDRFVLAVPASVILDQGSEEFLRIDAHPDLLKEIIVDVEDGRLVVKMPKKFRWNLFRNELKRGIEIHLGMKNIEGLSISGSGDIVADDGIKTDAIKLSISGSGDIKITDLDANELNSNISGSGDILLKGNKSLKNHIITISGSGDISAYDMKTDYAKISIAGSGDCKLYVTETLSVSIAGSGDIYYKGNPEITKRIAGSGSLHNVN